MKLVVVESPAKIKSIKKYLGSGYEVKASMGHFVDLPKSDLGVEVEKRYQPKYVVSKRKSLTELKKAFSGKDGLIIATDPDREGEAIGWHVANRLGLITNAGKLKNGQKLERIVFTSITKDAVQDAVKNPREIDYNLFNAQQARRVLDRLVGYTLSPLLWKKIRYGLSAGRVQSVALRLVVEREEEREAFVADEYWSIRSAVEEKSGKGEVKIIIDEQKEDGGRKQKRKELSGVVFELAKLNGKKAKIEKRLQAEGVMEGVLMDKDWKISDLQVREAKKYPKPPFTTSTLQRVASGRLGFSAKRTMSVAQKLYEQGRITYMRTDSTNLVPAAVSQARDVAVKFFGEEYIPKKANYYKTKAKVAQEAHEAIRPTDFFKTPKKSGLDGDFLKLYRLIWQRAVGSQMVPALVEKGRVEIEIKAEGEKILGKLGDAKGEEVNKKFVKRVKQGVNKVLFAATGQKMKFEGYLKAYPEKFEEQDLPDLKTGDVVHPKEVLARQHFTQPPARYSEASLIKTLEKYGIGRPSTYVPTLSTIQSRKYVEKEGKYFVPTDIGRVVIHLLKDHFEKVVDYGFTAKMESNLDDVANGEMDWVKMMDDFYSEFEKKVKEKDKEIQKEEYTVMGDAPSKIKCPECGGKMNVKLGRYGKFYSCKKWPDCKGMLGEDGMSESDREKQMKEEKESAEFQKTYKAPPKTEDGRDYLLKQGRFGKFWAHPDYPKVKDAKPLEYKASIAKKLYGEAPKTKDGKKMIFRSGRYGPFWAHPDYPKKREVSKIDKKAVDEKKKELGIE